MNILISLPIGIIIIIVAYVMALRVTSISRYVLAGVFALTIVAVYSFIAAVNWPGGDVYAIHLALYLLSLYATTIISSQTSQSKKLHWGPKAIFSFFAVVLITNSVFVYLAQTGMNSSLAKRFLPEPQNKSSIQSIFPGVVSHDFREKEGQFNVYQQQRQSQKALGWVAKLGWQDTARVDRANTFILQITRKNGEPLRNSRVTAKFLYPANQKYDQKLILVEGDNSLYTANVKLSQSGIWDVIVNVWHATGEYEIRSKTILK